MGCPVALPLTSYLLPTQCQPSNLTTKYNCTNKFFAPLGASSFPSQAASLLIKNTLDKKLGLTWHCAVGEGFGFDVTCQNRYLIYVFYGNTGILCYKC